MTTPLDPSPGPAAAAAGRAVPAPRCGPARRGGAAGLTTGALTNPLIGFCNRCEHGYQFTAGTPSTTTATGSSNTQGALAITVAAGAGFSTVGAFVVIDSSSVDGGAELVTVSLGWLIDVIPIADTPLRLTQGGATVNTAVMSPLGPMT